MSKSAILFLSLVLIGLPVFAYAVTGTIDSTYKYAWSNNIGWINFGCAQCNVQVKESEITGYAWSDNYGWIKLNPSTSGIKNNGNGLLSGSAFGENTGWIDFSNVVINYQGQFTGTATGTVAGTISFSGNDFGLKTDWMPNAGGGSPSSSPTTTPATLTGNFQVFINDGATKTNNPAVKLTLSTNVDVARVIISDNSNFSGAVAEAYKNIKTFVFPTGDGQKTIYIKFIDQSGLMSDTISANIILKATPPILNINQPQNFYKSEDKIIISGKSDPNSEIFFYWDNRYGMSNTNDRGDLEANLGEMSPGTHSVVVTSIDSFGNSKTLTIEVKVERVVTPVIPPDPKTLETTKTTTKTGQPIIQPIVNGIGKAISNIGKNVWGALSNVVPKEPPLEQIITIPKEAPEVLKHKWNLLPVKAQS